MAESTHSPRTGWSPATSANTSSYRPPPSETLYLGDVKRDYTYDDIVAAFSQLPGYSGVRIRTDKLGNPVAFIQFTSVEFASAAREALDGLLRIRPTDAPVSIHFARPTGIVAAASAAASAAAGAGGDRDGNGAPPKRPREMMNRDWPGSGQSPPSNGAGAGGGQRGGGGFASHPHRGDWLPNTSIYVDGLPVDCTEREVAHIFRPFIGYLHLRFVARPGKSPLCFVEFGTVEQSVAALEGLQGYIVDPKDPNDRGLRLEFAKAKSYGSGGARASSSGGGGALLPAASRGPAEYGGHAGLAAVGPQATAFPAPGFSRQPQQMPPMQHQMLQMQQQMQQTQPPLQQSFPQPLSQAMAPFPYNSFSQQQNGVSEFLPAPESVTVAMQRQLQLQLQQQQQQQQALLPFQPQMQYLQASQASQQQQQQRVLPALAEGVFPLLQLQQLPNGAGLLQHP